MNFKNSWNARLLTNFEMPTNFKNKIRSVSLDIIYELCRVLHKNARTTKSCSQVLRRRCLLLFIVYTVYIVTVLC